MCPRFVFFLCLAIGCTSEVGITQCKDLSWLTMIESSITQSGSKGEIYSFHYKNTMVYKIDACVGCPDFIITVSDCSGKSICEFGGIAGINTCPDFDKGATNKTLVWKN